MLVLTSPRPLDLAELPGSTLLDLTTRTQRVSVSVERVVGRGVLLGRHVGRSRVLTTDLRTERRPTSGPAVHLDGGVYVGFALPSLEALFKDATPRNLLNRYVRPMIGALRACGVQASYLGRDFISAGAGGERRAIFNVGYEGRPRGELLFEFLASTTSDLRIPREDASDLERATSRFGGRPTLPLQLVGEPAAFASKLREALVPALAREATAERLALTPTRARVEDPGAPRGAPLEVPIGWLDAFEGGRVGGDLLTASWVLGHAHETAAPEGALLDGATWADVMCANLRAQ